MARSTKKKSTKKRSAPVRTPTAAPRGHTVKIKLVPVDATEEARLIKLITSPPIELRLMAAGVKKTEVIKALRDHGGMSASQALRIVNHVPARITAYSAPSGTAELKDRLEAAGAIVELPPYSSGSPLD